MLMIFFLCINTEYICSLLMFLNLKFLINCNCVGEYMDIIFISFILFLFDLIFNLNKFLFLFKNNLDGHHTVCWL